MKEYAFACISAMLSHSAESNPRRDHSEHSEHNELGNCPCISDAVIIVVQICQS
eukprot:SAG31_NODE_3_length_45830_cov_42.279701_10_plen_54_part_00